MRYILANGYIYIAIGLPVALCGFIFMFRYYIIHIFDKSQIQISPYATWRPILPFLKLSLLEYKFRSGPPDSKSARLAQSVEHQTFNLRVEGSSPSLGALLLRCWLK